MSPISEAHAACIRKAASDHFFADDRIHTVHLDTDAGILRVEVESQAATTALPSSFMGIQVEYRVTPGGVVAAAPDSVGPTLSKDSIS